MELIDKQFLRKYLRRNFSFALTFLAYLAYFLQNSNGQIKVLMSVASISVLGIVIIVQLIINAVLINSEGRFFRFACLYLIFLFFTLLNLSYPLSFVTNQIRDHGYYLIRGRYILLAMLAAEGLPALVYSQRFEIAIRYINTFLIVLICTNILFYFIPATGLTWREVTGQDGFKSKITTGIHQNDNILFILLDEYSSTAEISKFTPRESSASIYLLQKYLVKNGFIIIDNNPTTDTSTIYSINRLFNQGSRLTFKKTNLQDVSAELRNSTVIKTLKNRGYSFANFSFFNIGQTREFYYLYLFPRNDLETLFQYSFFLNLTRNFTLNNLRSFAGFSNTSYYNSEVEKRSLDYLNHLKSNSKHLVYVHFLMPHTPFYLDKEFPARVTNLNNYIAYWEFCNKKMIRYLESVHNLKSYKIIISGDHGYRLDKIDSHKTMSAFYNFSGNNVDSISSVQDIGNLLRVQ